MTEIITDVRHLSDILKKANLNFTSWLVRSRHSKVKGDSHPTLSFSAVFLKFNNKV